MQAWFQREKQRLEEAIREVRPHTCTLVEAQRAGDEGLSNVSAFYCVFYLQEMQEAISNVHILNQNLEHLNDVVTSSRLKLFCLFSSVPIVSFAYTCVLVLLQGHEIVSISAVWIGFLQQMTVSAEKRR